eukprot:4478200-Karenia_brevis.AAC.1
MTEETTIQLGMEETKITFTSNPHRETSNKFGVFEKVRGTQTVGEAKSAGASAWDLKEWFKKGALEILSTPASSSPMQKSPK